MIDEGGFCHDNYEEERWYKNMELGPVGKRLLEDLIREQMSQNEARLDEFLQNDGRINEPPSKESRINKPLKSGTKRELLPLHDEDQELKIRNALKGAGRMLKEESKKKKVNEEIASEEE